MIYTVLKIEEDLDYGCEDRRDDQPVMAVVTLRSEEGKECTRKIPDQLLYEREIAQGDEVIFDENDQIRKKLGKDWTEHCRPVFLLSVFWLSTVTRRVCRCRIFLPKRKRRSS